MTLAQKICSVGAKTLAEFLCKPCSGGDKVFIPMSSMSGSLQVSDLQGSLQVSDIDGSLHAEDLQGSLQVSDIDGNLENKILGGKICQI